MRPFRTLTLLLCLTLLLTACRGQPVPSPEETTESGGETTAPIVPDIPSVSVTLPAPAETLTDFPALVTLDSSAPQELLLAVASGEGLAVQDASGTSLSYEIASLSAERISLWVHLPVYSADADTVLTVTLGGSLGGAVFGDAYDLVLHMNGADEWDSSEKKNVVEAFGSVKATEGAIGNALLFDGKSAYLTAGTPTSLLPEAAFEPIDNPYANTGYKKPTDWNHAQGLTTDGEYLYFAGHFDSEKKLSSIHKIRMSDMVEVDVFDHVSPMHSADMDYHEERGTLFVTSGGKHDSVVWEIDKSTGKVLTKWNLASVGYGIGAAITLLGGMDILLTTGNDGNLIHFAHITLDESGLFKTNAEWSYDGADLGVPQGIESLSSPTDDVISVYYLADAGAKVNVDPHYIYKIDLHKDGRLSISARYHISIGEETEGISFLKRSDGRTDVYFGSNAERIYKLVKPLEELTETPMNPPTSPNAFTVSCFVRLDGSDNTYPGILGYGAMNGNKNRFSLHLFKDTEGKLRFGTCLDDKWTKLDTAAGALPSDGAFHHVAAVYNGAEMRLYIDGERVGTLAVSGLLTDYGAPFSIGADVENGAPAFFFRGAIDEVRLVHAVRSDAWIRMEAAQIQ